MHVHRNKKKIFSFFHSSHPLLISQTLPCTELLPSSLQPYPLHPSIVRRPWGLSNHKQPVIEEQTIDNDVKHL